jgi:hypothetical protein
MLEPRARRSWGRGAALGGGAVCGWRELAGGGGLSCLCVLHSGVDWGSVAGGSVARRGLARMVSEQQLGRGDASEAERGAEVDLGMGRL